MAGNSPVKDGRMVVDTIKDGSGHPAACTHDPLPGYCRLLQKLGSGNEARWHCSALQHRVDLEVSASAWWGSAHPGAAEGPNAGLTLKPAPGL